MVAYFKEINFIETRQKARNVLKQFRKYERIAGTSKVDIRSPRMTDMPKSPGFNNRSEDAIVQYMYAEEERDEIMRAITSLNSTNKQILYLCFCHQERFNNRNIADELGYSIRSIEDKKAEALIEFAEAYRQGALRVYTKNWQEK